MIVLTGKIYDYFDSAFGGVQNGLRNMCALQQPWSMSARLRRGEFLSSPYCTRCGENDILGVEARTISLGQGQVQTFVSKIFRILHEQ